MGKQESDFNKVFNARDILMIAFGAMIGWGWVVSSADWIQTGGVIGAMLGFVIGGIMIFFIGLTYAELTPAMPENGGVHVFSHRAMGSTGSFICTWAIILGYIGVVCFESCAFPTVVAYLFPSFLKGYLYTVAGFDIYASWLAVAMVMAAIMTFVNLLGAKTAATLQNILTIVIGAAGILLVVASLFSGSPSNLEGQVFVGSSMGEAFRNVVRVAMMSPFFLIGFDVIPQAAEEINVPLKKIARILLLSIILAVSFYVLVIFAVGYMMDSSSIAASYASSGLVTADAMAKAFHSQAMAKVLIIAGLCGIMTSWNSFLIGGSRALYSMAKSYMIPAFFGKVSKKNKSPITALLLIGLLSMLAPLFGRKMLVWIVDAGNLGCCLAYCMVAISFVILRKKEPDMKRPYKVSHYKMVGALAIGMSGLMCVLYLIPGSGATLAPIEWCMVLGWIGLGAIFYFACKAVYKEKFGILVEISEGGEGKLAEGTADEEPSKPLVAFSFDRKAAEIRPALQFQYYLPVNVVFGSGKMNEAGAYAAQYGRKALIVTGHSSAKKSGLYDKVNDSLKAVGLETFLYDKATPNPLTTTAEEGAKFAKENGCDVVVAIGGGSIMDCAKGIAFAAVNEGDINDYIYGRKSSDDALPLVLIPTTCGTGSEGNGFAVLTNPENGDKKSLRCPAIVAKASIVDPDCMKTMPKKTLASVGFDALCHCIEAYTANNATPFTDALCLYAIPLIVDNLPDLVNGKESDEAWEKVSIASTIGGMVIGTSGVTLAHAMEHPVSGLKNVVHGQGLAAITPISLEVNYKGNRYKYGRLARILGGYTAEDCAAKVRTFLRHIGLELTLADLGVEEKDISWLADNCVKVSAGNLVNNPVSLTRDDIAQLYQDALDGSSAHLSKEEQVS